MLEEGVFPDDWKKSSVKPIHKRNSKNLIKNYRPISLVPIEHIHNKSNKCNKIVGIVKTFFNPVKKKLANNVQIFRQA